MVSRAFINIMDFIIIFTKMIDLILLDSIAHYILNSLYKNYFILVIILFSVNFKLYFFIL